VALRRRALLFGPAAVLAGRSGAQPAAGEAVHDLAITGGLLPPDQRVIRAGKGDRLRWRITSDTPGDFHLHALRLAIAVQPGQVAELAFTAFATGRFRASWHATGAADTGRHDAALLVLEVQPR
jgi:FtsP/CotA-like multicopper oxidase with cupredoxin domain